MRISLMRARCLMKNHRAPFIAPYIDTANMARPTWQPQYRTDDSITLITAELLSAQ